MKLHCKDTLVFEYTRVQKVDQFSIFHPAPLIIDPQKGLKKISVAELFTELILDKEKQCLYCEHGPPLSPEYL